MKNKNFFKLNLIYFVAMCLVACVFLLGYFGIVTNDVLSSFLIQIVVMFAIPLLLYRLLFKKKFKDCFKDFGFKKISGKMVAITIVLGFVLYFINSFVSDAWASVIAFFGYESLAGSTTVTLSYKFLFKEFVLSAILPGICEEFLHRGIMLHAGKKYANPRFCLIISSILFGLMHLNINQFLYAAILGGLMGYVALVSDSIFPTMIIHFMNNFLSSYFVYGAYLNWPFARFVANFETVLSSNIVVFVLSATSGVLLLIFAYRILVRMLARERIKRDVKNILNSLQLENLSLEDAQAKINMANQILNEAEHFNFVKNKENSPSFVDKIFLYSSLVLGGLTTIATFIWGLI